MDAKLINTLELNGDVSIPEKYIGPRGYSAYELAVKEGFEGTLDEWLESLHGDVSFSDLTETQKESLRGADGAPGRDGRDGQDAVSAINPRGNWDENETYNRNDYVTYLENGNAYTCVVDDTTGISPLDNTVWQILALRGADGIPGKDGKDGSQGLPGNTPTIGLEADTDEMYVLKIENIGQPTIISPNLKGPAGKDGIDGKDGTNGKDGASAASDVSFDDTVAGLGNANAPIDTVQKAIEALADDDIGSEQVQDMIDESVALLEPAIRFERNATLWEYSGLAGYIGGAMSIESNELAQYYLDAGYIIYATNSSVNTQIKTNYPNVVYEYSGGTLTKTEASKITFKSGVSLVEINKGVYIKGGSNWVDCFRGYTIMQREGIMKYNNATSGLTSKTVQGAIDELAEKINNLVDFTEVSF